MWENNHHHHRGGSKPPSSRKPPRPNSTSTTTTTNNPSRRHLTMPPFLRPSPLLFLSLLVFSLLLFFYSSSTSSPPSNPSPPVKIYMYDLPSKFTYGVIRSYLAARSNTNSPSNNIADDNLIYPGHQHSAEYFLFTSLIKKSSPFISVVSNPEIADLFYVPFFSSLSLIVNPIRPSNITNNKSNSYSDEAMQEELMSWLERQPYWRRSRGRDHVFICQDPNALYKVVDRIANAVLLVSDFGRLRPEQASLVKDVIIPYSHRINSFKGDVGVEARTSLLFFMGNRYRKEVSESIL